MTIGILCLVLAVTSALGTAAYPTDHLSVSKHLDDTLRVFEKSDGGHIQPPRRFSANDTKASLAATTTTTAADVSDHPCDGVYWKDDVTASVNNPFDPTTHDFRRKIHGMRVVGMETGCGNMQNRLLKFEDGSCACARYRVNADQTQGEVLSYYLSRLLNIPGVPTPVLAHADPFNDPRWGLVSNQVQAAQWRPNKLLVITPYVDSLEESYIPQELQTSTRSLSPVSIAQSATSTSDFVQWSDLILFDYLTGNVDRVVNNLFNQQWNADMMKAPAHNLMRRGNDSLVFLDNESGLLHSYRILDNYANFHEDLLKSLCVFRKETADSIEALHRSGNPAKQLRNLVSSEEPLAHHLPNLPAKHSDILKKRISNVVKQLESCKELYT